MDADLDSRLLELSLADQARLTAGADVWRTQAYPDAGIPAVKVTDGPNGARGGDFVGGQTALCLPVGVAMGATWDPDLIEQVGEALAAEVKTKQAQVLLAPTVNLHRSPLAGRNFECYSEDPLLTARLAVRFVRGVQRHGVGCAIKHFVGNESEFERESISSDIADPTLREAYLVPFEAAVREAGVWMVMSAYNKLNGTACSANRWLLTDLLRGEWGFDGAVVSDWFGTYSTVPSAEAGLDLEMPAPAKYFGAALHDAVESGALDQSVVERQAANILRVADRTGATTDEEKPEDAIDLSEHRELAAEVAVGSTVLLHNDGLLPLDPASVATVAVVGPNARPGQIQGGGSAQVRPHRVVEPLAGITERFGSDVEVRYGKGCLTHRQIPNPNRRQFIGADGEPGIDITFFNSADLSGEPVFVDRVPGISWIWMGSTPPGVDPMNYSVRWNGTFVPETTGTHEFGLTATGRSRVMLDEEEIVDNWSNPVRGHTYFSFGSEERRATVDLEAGVAVPLVVEYSVDAKAPFGAVGFGALGPESETLFDEAVEVARTSDVAIVMVGLNPEWESEGFDRVDLELPGRQNELVAAVAAVNPRTVVVVNAGSPVAMPWLDDVSAVLQVWYPGQEFGTALAAVLAGDRDPSGRLPTTFPRRLEDNPSVGNYPGANGHVAYEEGLLFGYRHYDRNDIEPLFPFGHGLSYSTFDFGSAQLGRGDDEQAASIVTGGGVTVTVPVTNTGDRSATTTVQMYIRDRSAPATRPDKVLAGFCKVSLDPGDTTTARSMLSDRAFARWDETANGWVPGEGPFDLLIGRSASDIVETIAIEGEELSVVSAGQ